MVTCTSGNYWNEYSDHSNLENKRKTKEEYLSCSLFYLDGVTVGNSVCDWERRRGMIGDGGSVFHFRRPDPAFGGRNRGVMFCSNSARGRMTFWKKCLLILLLQIGCLAAIEHTTRGLAYEEDQIRLILGNQFPSKPITGRLAEEESESEPKDGILSFHPKDFNFKESAVGMPRLGIVRVDNRLTDENLKLISISGSTVHFHSSFFADKVISPGGNTTFEVVFLSRTEGHAVSNLYIHTSKGLFKYKVEGFGLPNPYRLRPVVSARIPINGTYEPFITMHNPHEARIQVVEMLSSVADFHLELPDDLSEWEGSAWAIDPFQTKPVMKGCFHGKTEGNHTGYIKIRVNSTTLASEYLLVPVEVQVSSTPGIYSQQDSLDFGLLVRSDKPRTLSLSLINAQISPVNVQSVKVKGDPNSAVRIEFRPLVLESDSTTSIVVALITFDPSEIRSSRETKGLIEIQSDSNSIVIPFRATVVKGELEYNASSLGFFVKADHVPSRNFSVRNTFPTTMAIYHVSVSHPEIVQLEYFNKSRMISPGEQKEIFSMKVNRQTELCESAAEVEVTLRSNITDIKLPISCYDGKLQLYTTEPGQIDFGRLELYSSHIDYFSVGNANPVEIRLKSWGSNSTWIQIELVGMQKGLKEDLTKIQDFDSLKKSLFIQPGYLAVFSVEVRSPSVEGMFWGETFVTSDHNQTLRLPFHFSVAKGSIHSDSVSFEKTFPGKISYEKLHLSSTFNQSVGLRGVRGSTSSLWFTSSSQRDNSDLLPHRKNYVGKVHFDPKKFCGNYCYTGFGTQSYLGQDWIRGSQVSWETGEIDWKILKILQKRFDQVKDVTVSNMTLWIETGEVSGYKVKTQMTYSWPRLTLPKVVIFPLTSLANESVVDIPLINPSTSTIVVQALLSHEYGSQWSQFVQGNGVGGNITEGSMVFSLGGVAPTSSQSADATVMFGKVQKQLIQDVLGLNETSGVMFFLPAGAKFVIRVRFKPTSKNMASTLLLLRNNLTGIETTWVKGRAGTGQLTVGNGVSGSSLLFQLTEKLLQGCQREGTNKYVPAQLTVRRSFVARNVGEIPLEIVFLEVYPLQSSFWWNIFGWGQGDPCEGYGFRILNCRPFTLLPNQTHSIDIAFTPDFTMARIFRTLRLTDAGGVQFNFTLVAMVPSGMLSLCAAIITRPSWEPLLKYLLFAGLIISIFAASLMAYFEAGSIMSSALMSTVRVVTAESPDGFNGEVKETTTKLDLKQVYDKVDNRFKRNQANGTQPKSQVTNSPQGQSSLSSNHVSNSNSSGGTTRNRKKKNNNSSFESNSNQSAAAKSNSAKSQETNNNNAKIPPLEYDKTNNNNALATNHNKKPAPEVYNTKRKNNKGNKNNNRRKINNTPKCPPSPKIEEETSSTTTESSNADDLNSNLISLILDNGSLRPKERKTSGKSTGSAESISSCGGDVGTVASTVKPAPKTGNNKSKKGKKSTGNKDLNSNPNATHSGLGSSDAASMKGFEEVVWKRSSGNRKKAAVSGGSSSSGSRGSVSPNKDVSASLWDPPRPPSSNGLIEFSAPSESFMIHRSTARRSTIHAPSPISTPTAISTPIAKPQTVQQQQPLPSQLQQQSTMNNYQTSYPAMRHNSGGSGTTSLASVSSGNVNRRPGVIGQPRPLSSNPTTSTNGFMNNLLTTIALTMSTGTTSSGQSSRQHTPPARTLSSPNCSNNSTWEILPDNGCDIWNRTTTHSSNPVSDLTLSQSAFRPSTGTSGGYLNQNQTSYSSPGSNSNYSTNSIYSGSNYSTGLSYSSPPVSNHLHSHAHHSGLNSYGGSRTCSSPSQNQHSRMLAQKSSAGLTGYSSQLPPVSSAADASSFLFNSSLSNDLISSLWQLNSSPAFENQGQGSFHAMGNSISQQSQAYSTLNQTLGLGTGSGTGTSQQQQHGYLQRIKSEPNSRHRSALSNSSLGNGSNSQWGSSSSSYYSLENQNNSNSMHRDGLNGSGNGAIDLSKGMSALASSPSPTRMTDNSGWPSTSSSTSGANGLVNEATFSDWGLNLNLNLDNETNEIWNGGMVSNNGSSGLGLGSTGGLGSSGLGSGGLGSESKWATTYGQTPNFSDTLGSIGSSTIGSSAAPGQRLHSASPGLRSNDSSSLNTLTEHSFRNMAPHDLTQSQREVEAGLGFNPFISDIWNQPDASASSWTNPYQYTSNNE